MKKAGGYFALGLIILSALATALVPIQIELGTSDLVTKPSDVITISLNKVYALPNVSTECRAGGYSAARCSASDMATIQQYIAASGIVDPGVSGACKEDNRLCTQTEKQKLATAKPEPASPTNSCSWTGNWDVCLSNVVYYLSVGLMSPFAYIGSAFFSLTVKLALTSTAYAMDFVTQGWQIARDVANMAFLFILIYLAFTIMLRADSAGTMQTLAWVIIMALLINFSFFFTRVVIDGGNILASTFYNNIKTEECTGVGAPTVLPAMGKDLTACIMQGLSIQELFKTSSFQGFAKNSTASGWLANLIGLSLLYVAMGAMLAMLAFAFLTAGVKFLMRIIMLWFLIIASPAAFAAAAHRGTRKHFFTWWDQVWKYTIYPAVFLFMFFILNKFMLSMGKGGFFADVLNKSAISGDNFMFDLGQRIAAIGLKLGFVIGILYLALSVSEKLSLYGGGGAQKFSNWVGNRYFRGAGRLGAGGLAVASRTTAGWGANAFYRSNTGRALATKGPIGTWLWRGAGAVGRSSFDVRNAPGLAKGLGMAGINLGKAKEGGYEGRYLRQIRQREAEANALKPSASKLQAAQRKAIDGLNDSDKGRLKTAAEEYAKAREDYDLGVITRNELKDAKRDYDKVLKDTGVIDKAKEIAGANNNKDYAEMISSLNWANLGGILKGTPGWISAGDQEASARIRGGKNEPEQIKNILKDVPAATTPASGTTGTAGGATAPGTTNAADRNQQYRQRPQPAGGTATGGAGGTGTPTGGTAPQNPPNQPQQTASSALPSRNQQQMGGSGSHGQIPAGAVIGTPEISEQEYERRMAEREAARTALGQQPAKVPLSANASASFRKPPPQQTPTQQTQSAQPQAQQSAPFDAAKLAAALPKQPTTNTGRPTTGGGVQTQNVPIPHIETGAASTQATPSRAAATMPPSSTPAPTAAARQAQNQSEPTKTESRPETTAPGQNPDERGSHAEPAGGAAIFDTDRLASATESLAQNVEKQTGALKDLASETAKGQAQTQRQVSEGLGSLKSAITGQAQKSDAALKQVHTGVEKTNEQLYWMRPKKMFKMMEQSQREGGLLSMLSKPTQSPPSTPKPPEEPPAVH